MDERFSPQSKRDRAFVKSEEEIIDLWRGFFRTDEKDNIKEFFSVEQASLFKVFSTLIIVSPTVTSEVILLLAIKFFLIKSRKPSIICSTGIILT